MSETATYSENAEKYKNNSDNFEYRLLVGHNRSDGTPKSDQQLHSEYIERTDRLINWLTEGVPEFNVSTGEKEYTKPDYVVYLDKSARPLSWLVDELWDQLAVDDNGEVLPKTPTKFVNIDREQWVNEVDPEGNGTINFDRIDPSIFRSLRSLFLENPQDRNDGLSSKIDESPTIFDGKNILIVDEVMSTGRTLAYAKEFFRKAFGESNIYGTHWMSGQAATKEGAIGNADLPVWYDSNSPNGRGVGNRNPEISKQSESFAQRLGAHFLSTRHSELDQKAIQLRKEFAHLADDLKNHKVLYVPAISRDTDEADKRAVQINGFNSIDEYYAHRRELSHNGDPKLQTD